MGTRVKVFMDPLNLGHEKVTKTLWQVCSGNVRWQRGSLCFAEQFVRHRKKLLSGRAARCLSCCCSEASWRPVCISSPWPAPWRRFPCGQSGELTSSDALPVVVFCVPLWCRQSTTGLSVGGWGSGWPEGRGGPWLHRDQHYKVSVRKVSVGTLTLSICETLGGRLEIRKRHSLDVSRCDSTLWFARCCDRHLT